MICSQIKKEDLALVSSPSSDPYPFQNSHRVASKREIKHLVNYLALSKKYSLPDKNPSTAQSSRTRRCHPNTTTDYSCRQPSQHPISSKRVTIIARKIFKLLHSHPHIRVSWIKAHIGYIGNEEVDRVAKEAAGTENFPEPPLELPKSFIKTILRQKMMATSKWLG
ncbi:hypothetical protein AVEN_39477-1 [Araneus ventricosus]|uniref:RNase H type-1 domain-containing protein n=1 Tax=Araneus ventricosus TaxID=182803 RepID=A0A4Y2D5Z3_ARAVE|nr:hypothetical protein AVEN_39477-1 [Araneus ventricosus]